MASTDCPNSNGSIYSSFYLKGTVAKVPPTAGLQFLKQCGFDRPAANMATGFFYSFNDCIEMCASLNFWGKDRRCVSVGYYEFGVDINCWAHNETGVLEAVVGSLAVLI